MSKRATFTKKSLKRAVEVAQEMGFRIGGLTADGKVLVYSGDERPENLSIVPTPEQTKEGSSWTDR